MGLPQKSESGALYKGFQNAGTLEPGQLVMRVPGADIQLKYNNGDILVNTDGNVGANVLHINDIAAVETDAEGFGLLDMTGELWLELLENEAFKSHLLSVFGAGLPLLYSQSEDGYELVTMPSSTGDPGVGSIGKFQVVGYGTKESLPGLEDALGMHMEVAQGGVLITDRDAILRETRELVGKVSEVYDMGLKELTE